MEVVMVLPRLLVVVTATSTLVGALVWNADVVSATTLPAESVDEITTGTRTPVAVVGLRVALAVPPVVVAGVLTTLLPCLFVVVTGEGVLAAIVVSAIVEVTMVLPCEFVVVIGTVVAPPPLLLLEVPRTEDDEPCSLGTLEPAVAEERAEVRSPVLVLTTTTVWPLDVNVKDTKVVGAGARDVALDASLVGPLPAAERAGEVEMV